ncbi:MAG: FAD-binding oxidoreductase [Myxococcota bacterium]
MPPAAPAVSPWMDEPCEAAPSLSGSLETDVAVIGAGYTGLSTALALRAEGLRVAVLEREVAGFGASGRNAGHLTPTIGKDPPTLLRAFGRERARALVALAEDAVRHVERNIERFAIDCDYVPAGNVLAAVHPRQHARLERAAEASAALGAKVRFLPPEDMRKRGLPAAFTCGVLEECGGTLHPARYLRGLRRAALDAGVALHEQTPVLGLDAGRVARLRTPEGEVRAERVVLAANAFTPELGWLRSRVTRLSVSLFESAPLSPEQRDAVDWRGREGIYTAHELLESYRLTARGTVVGGSKRVRYAFGGRAVPDAHPPTFALLESTFRERFPELADVAVERFWSGPIACTLDFLPVLGRTGKHGNVLYGAGYSGHGIALASYAGPLLADLALERDGPARALTRGLRLPMPPEPVRWLVVHALTGLFALLDNRVDRAARAARAGRTR